MPEQSYEKHAGDNVPFWYDWAKELAKYGDVYITESHWNVDVGDIVIGADGRVSDITGSVTRCFISGGTPDTYCVLNNSVLLNTALIPDNGDKLVKRFLIHILDGIWEPMTPPVVVLPDGLADIPTLEDFRGATPGVSIWVDTTPSYPGGDLYYAVPDSWSGAPVDGSNVVQGQLVKWISIHVLGSYTGVLPSRRIDTTAPLTGGGDLSANRTLGISAATTAAAGSMSATDKTRSDAYYAANIITGSNLSSSLPNSLQLRVNLSTTGGLLISTPGPNVIGIEAPFGTTAGTYMQGNDSRVTGAVPSSRLIGGTSPIRVNGADSANLAADIGISVNNATTISVGVVQLAGDIGGTYNGVAVMKLRGTSVATAGGALATGKCLVTTGVDTCDWAYLSNANIAADAAIAITKLAGGSTGQILTMVGTTPTWQAPSLLSLLTGAGTTNKVAKFTGLHGLGDSSITDTGALVTIDNPVHATSNVTVANDLILSAHLIDATPTEAGVQYCSGTSGGLIAVEASNTGSSSLGYAPHFASAGAAPRLYKDAGGFKLTGSSETKALVFYTDIHGLAVPSDGTVRNVVGKLTLGWLGNGHLTNGAALEYLFALGLSNTGTISTFNVTALGSVLNGGQVAPTVTLSNSSNGFTFTVQAAAADVSEVTRFCYWIKYEWAKS